VDTTSRCRPDLGLRFEEQSGFVFKNEAFRTISAEPKMLYWMLNLGGTIIRVTFANPDDPPFAKVKYRPAIRIAAFRNHGPPFYRSIH
jgi:hypothetical protein